jgi:hypothetical protein
MPRQRYQRPGAGTEELTFDASEKLLAEVLRARHRGGLRCSTERRGTVPGTTTTIDREQRDGLYELVRNHLGGIGDIWVALEENREYVLAEQMGLEFGEDFRLLQDLGWEPEDKRKRVELTMEPHDLTELLTRLRGEAESVLEGSACMRLQRKEEELARERYRQAKDTCEELLAKLNPEKG